MVLLGGALAFAAKGELGERRRALVVRVAVCDPAEGKFPRGDQTEEVGFRDALARVHLLNHRIAQCQVCRCKQLWHSEREDQPAQHEGQPGCENQPVKRAWAPGPIGVGVPAAPPSLWAWGTADRSGRALPDTVPHLARARRRPVVAQRMIRPLAAKAIVVAQRVIRAFLTEAIVSRLGAKQVTGPSIAKTPLAHIRHA
jgi:hypothetical protein